MTARWWLAIGAGLSALGLAVSATAPLGGALESARALTGETVGGVFVVVGWALLAWGIHRLGRTG